MRCATTSARDSPVARLPVVNLLLLYSPIDLLPFSTRALEALTALIRNSIVDGYRRVHISPCKSSGQNTRIRIQCDVFVFHLIRRKPNSSFQSTAKRTMLRLNCAIFLTIILIGVANGRLIDTGAVNEAVPEVVARCRATCIDRFLYQKENMIDVMGECQEQSTCLMCWDFCQFLHKENQDVRKNMCDNVTCVS